MDKCQPSRGFGVRILTSVKHLEGHVSIIKVEHVESMWGRLPWFACKHFELCAKLVLFWSTGTVRAEFLLRYGRVELTDTVQY